MRCGLGILILLYSVVAGAQEKPSYPPLPTSQQWLVHINEDIAPYYFHPDALGKPPGSFPTFRCNDGALVDPKSPCAELSADWIAENLGRQYTRMLSRQIYTYGVIFHLTGDERALQAAKAGVDYLRSHLLDRKNGGAVTYLTAEGNPGLKPSLRTTQDLAYAQLGMAFYYYLSRDPEVLTDIIALKNYIFSRYYNPERHQLMWVLEDGDGQSAAQQELVAQLDQINAYMLLMIPLLPDEQARLWRRDLRMLCDTLLAQFHDADAQRFYGYIHHQSGKVTSGRHGDRGHSVKAYWMLYLSSRLLGDEALAQLAEKGMRATLESGYAQYYLYELMADTHGMDPDMEVGLWNARENQTGSSWWEHAELDQSAQTLALKDPTMNRYLGFTYGTWMKALVDHEKGGIWSWANDPNAPKLHQWKNGYHGAEHALIGYLGAAQREGQSAKLYFAVPESKGISFSPYYFSAKSTKVEKTAAGRELVSFSGIY